MNIVYRLGLDLQHPDHRNIIEVKQRDHKGRTLQMTLLDGGAMLDMTDVIVATVKGIYDGTEIIIYADATILTDEDGNNTNVVTYTLGDTILGTAGRYTFELELLGAEDEVVSSFEFYVVVANQLYDEDDYVTESDLSGFRSYMVRALNAATLAENTERKFEIAYGTVEEAINEMAETVAEYEGHVEDLEEKAASGYFIGPQGPQGENGRDAIITDMEGLFALQITGTDLVLHYGTMDPPDLSIVGDTLVWSWEE